MTSFSAILASVSLMLGIGTSTPPIPVPKCEGTEVAINRCLISYYAKVYGVDPDLAIRISKCESGLTQFKKDGTLIRGIVNNGDSGLYQINEGYHLKESIEQGFDIHDRIDNIRYGLKLLKEDGTRHWNASKGCWDI